MYEALTNSNSITLCKAVITSSQIISTTKLVNSQPQHLVVLAKSSRNATISRLNLAKVTNDDANESAYNKFVT